MNRPESARRIGHRHGGVAILLLAIVFSSPTFAGDKAAGQKKARACITCHGAQGISQLPNAPNLAGQPEIYLVEQLNAYRSGKRTNEIMSLIAKPLSDGDIADLAAWFSSFEISVKGEE